MNKRKLGLFISAIILVVFALFFGFSKNEAVKAESGHSHDDLNFTSWTTSTSLPTTYGYYVLDTDVTLSSTWVVPETHEEGFFFYTVVLCLNGHVIKSDGGNFSLITVYDNCDLTIMDCNTTVEHKGYVDANGLWHLGEKAQLAQGEISKSIYGGVITGGKCLEGDDVTGGAINIAGGSALILGGTIAGNTANNGGGIIVNYNATTGRPGTLSMDGGNVSYNTAMAGAGLYVGAECIANLTTDATVSYNTAKTSENNSIGGGICVGYNSFNQGGVVYIQGATISNNYADFGGGVYVCPCDSAWLNFECGSVINNTAQFGGGIYSQGCTSIEGTGGNVYITGNTATVAVGGFSTYTFNCHFGVKNGLDIIIKDNICTNTYNDGKFTYPKNFATSETVSVDAQLSDKTEIYYSYIDNENMHNKGMFTGGFSTKNPTALVDTYFKYDGPSLFIPSLKENPLSGNNEIFVESEIEILNTRKEVDKDNYHGYLELSKNSANENETITINVHTNEGATFDENSLKATYIKNKTTYTLTLTEVSDGVYSFTMPAYPVTIEADFISYQTHDNITFKSWSKNNCLPDEAGNYFLDFDVVLTEDWEVPAGIVNLCLNGKIINLNSNNYTDKISIVLGSNSTLNLYDCDETTVRKFSDYYGFWTYNDSLVDPAHTLYGGLITKGYNSAILVNGGTLNIYGGNIVGNKAPQGGAAINLYTGTLNIYGGVFAGNDGNLFGGAIYIENGTFTLNGGTFASNNCAGGGGAIYVASGLFTMNDGEIIENDSRCAICLDNSEFYMNGGLISGNTDYTDGGAGVLAYNSIFTMNGGEISENYAASGMGGGVYVVGGTFTLNDGLITNNYSENVGGGVYLDQYSIFIMNDGEISYNGAFGAGGGVYVSELSKFIMHGGEISYNESQDKAGGGVALQLNSYFLADGGIITQNTAPVGGGVYASYASDDFLVETCLAKGTPITLKDGTTALIESLSKGDEIRVFDHETGTISSSKVFDIWKFPNPKYGAMTLHFTNDIDVTIVGGHCFFEKTAQKYVNVNSENIEDYIGKDFYNADYSRYETLVSVTYIDEPVETYILVSENNYNSIANGMLSNVDGLYTVLSNIFDFDEDLKWNATKKASDIAEYGTWEYDDEHFHYVNEDAYEALNLQYLSVAIGKGLLTLEELRKAAENTLNYNYELLREDILDSVGIYLGGTIQIKDNFYATDGVCSDLFLWNNGPIVNIGTGIIGNGCKAPEEGMEVHFGIYDYDDIYCDAALALNAKADYAKYFIPVEDGYAVKFYNNNTPNVLTDDYLAMGFEYIITNATEESDKEDNHGYISIADEPYFAGDTVIVDVKIDENYTIKTIKYNDGTNDVNITETNGIYSFTMPAADITISAVFETISLYNERTGKEYCTLEDAILEAEDEDTIVIIENLVTNRIETGDKSLTFKPEGKNITIKLKGPMLFGVNNSDKTFVISGGDNEETLTINVAQIEGFNSFRPIAIRNGNTLIIEDGVILSGSNVNNIGGGMINVASNATLKLDGGIIENSKVNSTDYDATNSVLGRGGAIYVNENATFIMTSGEIRNCQATVAGGAIYSVGRVEISGGKITNCSVSGLTDNGVVKAKGGAIYIMSGSFVMTGGEISGNKLANVADMRGAGVYAATGVEVKLGGSAIIANNTNGLDNNSNLFLYDLVLFEILSEDLAPTDTMNIGVASKTLATKTTPIKLSSNGTKDDVGYFYNDNPKEYIKYNTDALYLYLNTDITFDSDYEINDGEELIYGNEYTIDEPSYDYFGETVEVELVKKYYEFNDNSWKLLDDIPTNVGSYKVVFEVSDDLYTGSFEYEFNINKKTITLTITDVNTGTYQYDGTAKTTVATYDSLVGTDTLTYELDYSDNINAGTCVVTIKSAAITNGDSNNYELVISDEGSIVIDKADMNLGLNILAPSIPVTNLVYNGKDIKLLTAGLTLDELDESSFGTFYYSLDGKTYTTTLPTAIYPKEYNPVWYFVGDDNHNGIGSAEEPIAQLFPVEILKGGQAVAEVIFDDYAFDTTVSTPAIDVKLLDNPTVTYYYSLTNTNSGGVEFKDITAQSLNVGTYYMYVVIGETDNYEGYTSETTEFEVTKGTLTDNTQNVSLTYDGLDHANLEEIEAVILIKDSLEATQTPTSKMYSVNGVNYALGTDINWATIEATDAGSYKVYYKYAYDNFNEVNGSFTLTINKAKITKPTADDSEFVYDGTVKTYTLTQNSLYTITGDLEKTNAGTNTITVAINDKDNYSWNDDTDTDLTFDFVIAKKTITLTITDVNAGTYQYDGTAKTTVATYDNLVGTDTLSYELAYSDNINAGSCVVTIKSATITNGSANNYNIITTDKGVIVIDKVKVAEPTIVGEYTWTGSPINANINGLEAFMTVSSESILSATEAGVYEVIIDLDENHEWEDGSDGVLTWEIKATTITPKDNGQGEKDKQDVVVEFEGGFTNDIEVVVEVTLEIEVSSKALTVDYYDIKDENLKLDKHEKIGVVFDVKLVQLVNGVQVDFQPEDIAPGTIIKVKMLIPENVNIKKVSRILHVHSSDDIESIEFDINKVDADRYYEIEVDKLSEFAFVYKDNGRAWVHWTLIAVLVVGIALFAYFKFMQENEFIALITTGSAFVVSIILSFFGDCAACTVFSIINIVLFAVGTAYLLYNKFFSKKNSKEE